MEYCEQEIRTALQALDAMDGLEPLVILATRHECDSHPDSTSRVRSMRDPIQQQQHIHSLRRILRRLDRSLLLLHENLLQQLPQPQQQQDPTIPHAGRQWSQPSDTTIQDLLTILTRLRIPAYDEASLECSVSIMKQTARIWMDQGWLLPTDTPYFQQMLRRTLHYADLLLCAPWLQIINAQLVYENSGQSQAKVAKTSTMNPGSSTSATAVVGQLHQCLNTGRNILRAAPHWDIHQAQNESAEAALNWHNLTTILLDQVIEFFHQDTEYRKGNNSTSTQSSHQPTFDQWSQQQYQIHCRQYPPNETTSGRLQGAESTMYESISAYIHQLLDFALDALDGAAAVNAALGTPAVDVENVTNQGTLTTPVNLHPPPEQFPAILANALGHVMVAASALNHWSRILPDPTMPLTLWKSLATAFIQSPHCSTVTPLVLLAARMTVQSGGHPPTSTLTMTFIRALQVPEQLLVCTELWSALQLYVGTDRECKHTLQACALSLQCSRRSQYPYLMTLGGSRPKTQQKSPQTDWNALLIQRIMDILPIDPTQQHDRDGSVCTRDPWDTVFFRRMEDFVMHRPM